MSTGVTLALHCSSSCKICIVCVVVLLSTGASGRRYVQPKLVCVEKRSCLPRCVWESNFRKTTSSRPLRRTEQRQHHSFFHILRTDARRHRDFGFTLQTFGLTSREQNKCHQGGRRFEPEDFHSYKQQAQHPTRHRYELFICPRFQPRSTTTRGS